MPIDQAKRTPVSGASLSVVFGCSLVSLGLKALLLAWHSFPFNADEAIVGLMARHILAGQWPTFFYGQAYLGSTDAVLAAAGFGLFGPRIIVIRGIQAILFAAGVATTVALAARAGLGVWGQAASGLLMAIPPVFATVYTTVSIGGYGEVLVLGNLLFLLSLRLATDRPSHAWCLAWGVLAGFAFWTFSLSVVYSVPSFALLVWHWRRGGFGAAAGRVLSITAGGILGALPMLSWATLHGAGPLLQEVTGGAIAGASPTGLLASTGNHLLNFVLFGPSVILGARPPWDVSPLALPLLPLAVAFWVLALFVALRPRSSTIPSSTIRILLGGLGLVLIGGFILTPFGADPSGRYFLPLTLALSLAGGAWIARIRDRSGVAWAALVLAVPVAFALWGNLQAARHQPPGLTTQFDAFTRRDDSSDQALIDFLRRAGETRGYTTYWVSYPLAFLTDEELIFVPRLPYHADLRYTSRDDRYPAYDEWVEASPKVAYVTSLHPALDESLQRGFREQGVTFDEADVGGYHIFYHLSRPVAPWEMGIGLP